jgi:hypothetical protein
MGASDRSVTANYQKIYTLTMRKAGSGDGTVTPDVGIHIFDDHRFSWYQKSP